MSPHSEWIRRDTEIPRMFCFCLITTENSFSKEHYFWCNGKFHNSRVTCYWYLYWFFKFYNSKCIVTKCELEALGVTKGGLSGSVVWLTRGRNLFTIHPILLGTIQKGRHRGRGREGTQKYWLMVTWGEEIRYHYVFLNCSHFVHMKLFSSRSFSHVRTGKSKWNDQ